MFAVNVLGNPAWLVPFGPNTDDPVSIKARVEIDEQRGQTGRGSRRPQARLLRFDVKWFAKMKPADFYAARAAVLGAQDEPVVVPFWPAARKATDAAVLTSALTVAWTRNWATYAINPGSLAAYDFFAPLVMGVFTQPPRLDSQTSDYIVAEFSFSENALASVALVMPADADVTLVTPDGYAAPVFPFSPEGTQLPKLTLGQVDVDRQPVGPGRQTADAFYPQQRETVTQPSYKFKTAAAAIALCGWWLRRGGGAGSCWVATTQKIGDLSANMAAGAGTLPTTAALAGVVVGDTLALLTTGQAAEFVRVASIPAGVVNFSGATAAAHSKMWTTIVPALLARHTDPELALDFRRAGDDWVATCTLGFREVAAEYAVAGGETRGTTIGRLPITAWLFRIDLDYAGAVQSWFLTNFESGVTTPDAQVWEYHPCDFDKLTQSIDLEEDACTFTIRWWAGCPWENWMPGKLAATGTLTILRAAVAADGTVSAQSAIWKGQLSKPDREAPIMKVKVLGANALFSQKAPHAVMKQTCWKRLYGVDCGIDIADWKFNALVSAIGAHTITINTIARANGGGLPAGFAFADWFALGFVQWVNGAGQPLRSEVLGSTVLAGGAITLTLGRQLGWIVGSAVVAVPGCDKQASTCWNYDVTRTFDPLGALGKFDNHINFGGFRTIPAVSPNFVIPQKNVTPAKK